MYEHLVWLVPLTVAALGVWRPRAGLLALAASLPLFGSPPGGPYLGALEVAGLAAIVTAWRGGRPDPTPLGWPVVALVTVSLASLVPLTYLPPAWRPAVLLELLRSLPGVAAWQALYTWRAALDLLLGWGLFLAVRRAFAGRSPRPLALALLAGLVPTLLLGVATQLGLASLDGFRPQLPRLESLFFLAGWFSQYLVLVWPLALAGLTAGGRRARLLAVPVMALVLACLALTLQRGAWIAMGVQLLGLAVAGALLRWRPVRWRRLAVLAAVSLGLAAVLIVGATDSVKPVLERATSIRSGVVPRLALWRAASLMVRERPLLGWGVGSYAPAYDMWFPGGTYDTPRTHDAAHSLYFQVASERGLLGLAALGLVAWGAARCLRRPRPGHARLAVALGLCLVGAAVYGLVQYVFYLRGIAWLLWLALGAVAVIGGGERSPGLERTARVVAVLALVLVPVRAARFEAPAYPGNRSLGFHKLEQSSAGPFRWTERFAARRLAPEDDVLALGFANGHPRPATRPVSVEVGVDGERLAVLTIRGGWEEHRFRLASPRPETILLTITARPTFRPFSDYLRHPGLERSKDVRALGVAVAEPRWESSGAVETEDGGAGVEAVGVEQHP